MQNSCQCLPFILYLCSVSDPDGNPTMLLLFQGVSVSVSVLTLTCISIERWYAICHPLMFKSTPDRAKFIILIIWVIALSLIVPEVRYTRRMKQDSLSVAAPNFYMEAYRSVMHVMCKSGHLKSQSKSSHSDVSTYWSSIYGKSMGHCIEPWCCN